MPILKKQVVPARHGPGSKKVEDALLRRALGFTQEEIYSEAVVDKKSGEVLEVLKRKVVKKEIPPDVRALLFWLKNRLPGRWSERNSAGQEAASPEYEFDETEQRL